jgi:hypothetical protein
MCLKVNVGSVLLVVHDRSLLGGLFSSLGVGCLDDTSCCPLLTTSWGK